ncbi:MAG: hypothetical protein A2667_01980 [Candidatus Wildermuthbacteria bacterium RIFCSPHIGHO2_01_FULL_47_27]|uniref:3D domain-containing protein n=2 Tax=Candidatus Wildermuthiibacteriota TaxID=1817923 RepID=A0A1G2RNP6_9BACT|nr:MAG: hypothetical protein UY15_C0010G0001 [Parcubacteria group bacterium GW2011_GWA2_47_9]OHA64295.1 MAG: hypothetical protein A2667_01980 [Candidatus Wildermuthbacteria bacterium RIFCSPHIGHO2_01_FULL_47_27]OHA67187.1 MAG: hypothetical protein A3D59_02340 [Candidatus Wildermuthbacteria bacterium RIFCSPHIGHO2_02_FULL_47_17]OHA74474.1 MAG: hypothetical protein A3A32_00745 [Candidatus Wildermuthbacteria bacterium RIFCSPLOWO2_01_FULL_48_35]
MKGINPFASFLLLEMLLGIVMWYPLKAADVEAVSQAEQAVSSGGAPMIQNNSLLPLPDLITPPSAISERVVMVITAYSSSVWETDDDPHITAAGTSVRPGIVANNLLPMGTKVRLPELYGDKVFVVEDRMNSRKGKYQLDVWFPSHQEAKNFGSKKTYVDIMEN